MPHYPLFPNPLISWFVFLGSISTLLLIIEVISRKTAIQPENSRLAVHMMVGLMILSCRFIFQELTYPLITAALFAALNFLALRQGLFKSMHATERISLGTVYFPIAFLLLVLVFWETNPVALQTGVLLLALADPAAAIVGRKWGRSTFKLWHDAKTVTGSVTMASVSFVLVLGTLKLAEIIEIIPADHDFTFPIIALLTALVAMIAEVHSRQGSDNLTVPLSAAFLIHMLMSQPSHMIYLIAQWSIGSGLVLWLGYRIGALTVSGFLTAWAMGLIIFTAGGWIWIIPIVAFFILSTLLTRMNKLLRSNRGTDREHVHFGRRNMGQVLANGGIPMLLALVSGVWEYTFLYPVYLAVLAAATADTWATEIGSWASRSPRHIISWQRVEKGSSGGITFIGTAGSLGGAVIIAGLGSLLAPDLIPRMEIYSIISIGFSAALLDSILGGTLQVRWSDAKGTITESKPDESASIHHGLAWLTNSSVNLVCSVFAACIGLALLF